MSAAPLTYLAHFRDAHGHRWIEETAIGNGLPAIAAWLIADERPYATLVEVYEMDLTDPDAPVARTMTGPVLGKAVDLIDLDDERDDLPASLRDAARRHGVPPCAPKERRSDGPDFLAWGREEYRLQVEGRL
ncbi:hypothetical protein [Methylobacterium sp. JK268]